MDPVTYMNLRSRQMSSKLWSLTSGEAKKKSMAMSSAERSKKFRDKMTELYIMRTENMKLLELLHTSTAYLMKRNNNRMRKLKSERGYLEKRKRWMAIPRHVKYVRSQ